MVQKSGVHSPVEVGSVSHCLQGFTHPRWLFGISSINSFFLSKAWYFNDKNTPISEEKPRQTSFAPSPPSAVLLGWSAPLQKKRTARKPQPCNKKSPRLGWKNGSLWSDSDAVLRLQISLNSICCLWRIFKLVEPTNPISRDFFHGTHGNRKKNHQSQPETYPNSCCRKQTKMFVCFHFKFGS